LRELMAAKGSRWREWQYKFFRGNIIIGSPVTPWNPRTGQPEPSMRYLAKHLRIVPVIRGPFGLQYWRHTQQWSPLPCVGDLKEIADFIAEDPVGLCGPLELPQEAWPAAPESECHVRSK